MLCSPSFSSRNTQPKQTLKQTKQTTPLSWQIRLCGEAIRKEKLDKTPTTLDPCLLSWQYNEDLATRLYAQRHLD